MLKEIISQGNFAIWPQISLVLFFTTFTGILIWVRRKGSDTHYQSMAELAVNDQDGVSGAYGKEHDHE